MLIHNKKERCELIMQIFVNISFGELIDKITILEIKSQRIADEAKLRNVHTELKTLSDTWAASEYSKTDISEFQDALKAVNEDLWDIEDQIRVKESLGEFDDDFIELARSVYIRNDERARLKKSINQHLGSELEEEKSYADYTRK